MAKKTNRPASLAQILTQHVLELIAVMKQRDAPIGMRAAAALELLDIGWGQVARVGSSQRRRSTDRHG